MLTFWAITYLVKREAPWPSHPSFLPCSSTILWPSPPHLLFSHRQWGKAFRIPEVSQYSPDRYIYIYFKCSASIADNLQAMTKCHLQKERGATPHQLPGLWAMHQTSVFPLSPPYDFSSVIIIILLLQLSTFLFLFSPMPAYCSPRSVLQEGRNASKHTEGQQAKSSSGAR